MKRFPLIPWIALSFVLVAALGSTGCSLELSAGDGESKKAENKKDGDDSPDGEEEEKKEEAVPVEVTALTSGPIEARLHFSTNLEAEDSVQVFAEAKRQVTEILVEEGDRVRRGQVLLRLRDEEQQSAVAKVKSQLAKAEREYQQQSRLFKQELISEQVYNDATYELDQLKISLEDAERELSYTIVKAPIRGTISSRMVSLGDTVQIGQQLFDIVDFNSIVARVYVPEKHLPELRPGLRARLSAGATAERTYTGKIERIAPVVDPKSGTVKVTIDVGLQAGLRPGMYVDVDLITATHENAVLVPKRALVYDNDQAYLFRLGPERRVERVFVEAQLTDKNFVEPREGFQTGDEIVVAGQAGLKDGALVRLPGDPDPAEEEDEDPALEADGTEQASL